MAISDIVKASLEHIRYIAKTETVFGEAVVVNGMTLIPVSRVSIGFAAGGAGADDKNASGAGTGGGVNVTPVAVIAVSADGDVQIHSMENSEVDIYTLLSMAPDAVRKVAKFFKKKGGGGKDKDEEIADSDDSGDSGAEPAVEP